MANTDKNILITPNIGSTTDDPKIVFSGADSSTAAQNITLKAYPTSNGTLSFEGSAGQLFSITNDLTGTIFSVNDISGIPSIEVDADGEVRLAEFGGVVKIGGNTAVRIPVGTTAQRPTPELGQIRYNTTTSQLEYYTDDWYPLDTFIGKTDTPASYTGFGEQLLIVSNAEDAVGFTDEIDIDELIHSARVAPTTVDTDSVSVYVTATGTTPNREVAYKIKNELGQEIIISSILV